MSTFFFLSHARNRILVAVLFAVTPLSVLAQTTESAPPTNTQASEAHDPGTHASMHEHMSHDAMSMTPPAQSSTDQPPTTGKPEQHSDMGDMGDMDMSGMDMSSMQGGRAPPDARDPDYSEGQMMSTMPGMAESMNDDAPRSPRRRSSEAVASLQTRTAIVESLAS